MAINSHDKDARIETPSQKLRLDHLSEEEKDYVINIIPDYQHLFHLAGEPFPATDVLQHSIITIDNALVFIKQYRCPPAHIDETRNQVANLLENSIIENSYSEFNCPFQVVPKNSIRKVTNDEK